MTAYASPPARSDWANRGDNLAAARRAQALTHHADTQVRRLAVATRALRIVDALNRATRTESRPDYSDPDYGLTARQAETQRRIARCSCGSWVVLGRPEWMALVERDIRPECRHYAADVVA